MAYTDFLDLAQARYSVRKFLDKKVPKDIIEKILKAGMLAPTGCNNQPQRIIVVESDESIAKIKECIHCPARYGLPCRRCKTRPRPRKLPPGKRAYQLAVIKTITT